MALIETWVDCYLGDLVKIRYLEGNVFSMDKMANRIGVNVYDTDGNVTNLTGVVTAHVIRADGNTVAVTGSYEGNKCWVDLPQACYYCPGTIVIAIKLTSGTTITTLACIVSNVYQSRTGSVVDPGTIIPSIETLITNIDAAVASIPADYSALWTKLAPAFSDNTNYVAGQYVTYNGGVYRFTTTHSAGSWNSSHVVSTNIGGELTDLKSAINNSLVHEDWSINPVKGYYLATATGKRTSSSKYAISGLWNKSGRIAFELTDNTYEYWLSFYNENGDVSTPTGYLGCTSIVQGVQYISDTAAKIGITFRRTDQAILSDADVAAIKAAAKVYYSTDTSLTQERIAADAKATGERFTDVENELSYQFDDVSQMTVPIELDIAETGTETYPTGWQPGYYATDTGEMVNSNRYLATINKFKFNSNIAYIYAIAPEGYGIRISEFDSTDTLVDTYGTTGETVRTKEVHIPIKNEYGYGFTIGRFNNNDASSYNNDTFLAGVKIIMIRNTIEDIYNDLNALTVDENYDWTEIGTTTYPTGWRPGYYMSGSGEWKSSVYYLGTVSGIAFNRNVLSIDANVPNGYGIRISEYDNTGTYLNTYGNSGKTNRTKNVKVFPKEGYIYKFTVGRFANADASDYNNSTFLAGVTLTIKELKSGVENKKGRTRDYEFFTVNVSRPLSFGGEEIGTTEDTIECVLRLPTTYSMTGKPTRLVLACHGAHGYIQASTSTWYNSNWKTFMDALLDAGYAVFDANVLPLSAGVSPTNYAGGAYGSPLYINVLKNAYDYIVENYNVTKQIFAHGTSMGGVGATAFAHAYPEIVLAESSFAGRNLLRYLYALSQGTSVAAFPEAYGYADGTALSSDHFSHVEGSVPDLSIIKYVNGVAQIPPDRETAYSDWLAYYGEIANLGRNDDPGVWMGVRQVPYKAWNSWEDNENYTKLQTVLQKVYNRGNSCPYCVVNYESGTHTQMSYGQINDMIPQLIAWYKRWE